MAYKLIQKLFYNEEQSNYERLDNLIFFINHFIPFRIELEILR